MSIRFRLREFLEEHDITPYRLSKESGVTLRTIYGINRDLTKRIDKETLNAVMIALEELTGKSLEVSDLITFVKD